MTLFCNRLLTDRNNLPQYYCVGRLVTYSDCGMAHQKDGEIKDTPLGQFVCTSLPPILSIHTPDRIEAIEDNKIFYNARPCTPCCSLAHFLKEKVESLQNQLKRVREDVSGLEEMNKHLKHGLKEKEKIEQALALPVTIATPLSVTAPKLATIPTAETLQSMYANKLV